MDTGEKCFPQRVDEERSNEEECDQNVPQDICVEMRLSGEITTIGGLAE